MPSRGIIFVATGESYIELALQAATSCKHWMPELPIDLFTDGEVSHPAIDRAVPVGEAWRRSKLDHMASSRFDETLYLDADVVAVDRFDEAFGMLARFDLCGAYDQMRVTWNANKIWREEVPESFPQINTGVLFYRNVPKVLALFEEWRDAVRGHKMWRDQPVFRELVWKSDLGFGVLPEEYNYMATNTLPALSNANFSPRLIHSPRLHRHLDTGRKKVSTLEELLGPELLDKIEALKARRADIIGARARRAKNL